MEYMEVKRLLGTQKHKVFTQVNSHFVLGKPSNYPSIKVFYFGYFFFWTVTIYVKSYFAK